MQFLFFIFMIIGMMTSPAAAQKAGETIDFNNAYVHGPITFMGQMTQNDKMHEVQLWGVQPLGLLMEKPALKGIMALENIIHGTQIRCTFKTQKQAQCLDKTERDIAVILLEAGMLRADHKATDGTVFNSIYKVAEDKSRKMGAGYWGKLGTLGGIQNNPKGLTAGNKTPFVLTEDLAYLIIGAMIAGPFVGMLVVAFIIYGGFRRLIALQRYQLSWTRKQDQAVREREKHTIATALEGEIATNRSKLEAFITIYHDMLKNLRDPTREPKYKKGGDIVHEKPALARLVFDSHMNKLDLLGHQMVTDLTDLYNQIEPNPNYTTIEPDTPLTDVIKTIESIVKEAEALLQPLDRLNSALNIILRDKNNHTG